MVSVLDATALFRLCLASTDEPTSVTFLFWGAESQREAPVHPVSVLSVVWCRRTGCWCLYRLDRTNPAAQKDRRQALCFFLVLR